MPRAWREGKITTAAGMKAQYVTNRKAKNNEEMCQVNSTLATRTATVVCDRRAIVLQKCVVLTLSG